MATATLLQSDQLLTALRIASGATSTATQHAEASMQTEQNADGLGARLLELLHDHAVPPAAPGGGGKEKAFSASSSASAKACTKASAAHAVAAGWLKGVAGRQTAAERLRELLLTAGILDHTCAPPKVDMSVQVSLAEEEAGRGFWAAPVPAVWRPSLSEFPPLPVGMMGRRQLRSLLWSIYSDRVAIEPHLGSIRSEETAAAENTELTQRLRLSPPPTFADFVLEWCVGNYGTRLLASGQLTALVAAMRRFAAEDLRVRTFCRFCGASLEGHDLDAPSLRFFAQALYLMFSLKPGSAAFFATDSTYVLSVERAHAVAAALFPSPSPSAEKLRAEIASRAEASKRAALDADDLLLMLLIEHQELEAERGAAPGAGGLAAGGPAAGSNVRRAANLFRLFASADRNGSGSLSLDELQALIVDQQRRSAAEWRDVLAHAKALGGEGAGGVGVAVFVEVCGGRAFHEVRAADERSELEVEWVFRQPAIASQLAALRAWVAETGGRQKMSNALLDRSVASLEALAAAMQPGRDEAAARKQLHALEDALRRGGVAIELEQAGGGVSA